MKLPPARYIKAAAYGAGVGSAFATEGMAHGVSTLAHRSRNHGSVTLHPALDGYCRFRLWTTTGQKVRQWVGVHRKHHRYSDVPGDPHSPVLEGSRAVKWFTAFMYRRELRNSPSLVQEYAPDLAQPDKLDKYIFDRGSLGVLGVQPLMLAGALRAVGLRRKDELAIGTAAATATSLWIALRAGGEVNSRSHEGAERDPETYDYSINLGEGVPGVKGKIIRAIGSISTAGEATGHRNHHLSPESAIFNEKPALDPVGAYIGFLHRVGLAEIHHVDPRVDPRDKYPRAQGDELMRLQQITPAHILSEQPSTIVA